MTDLFYKNQKAYFKYEIVDTYLAGMVLTGFQVKAIRAGNLNISEAFCRVINNEMILFNVIFGGLTFNDIKLLLNRKEIKKIAEEVKLNNRSVVPLSLSMKRYAKLSIGLGKGKKTVDKRETIKKRDLERENAR